MIRRISSSASLRTTDSSVTFPILSLDSKYRQINIHPLDETKNAIIVSIHKVELTASGGLMADNVWKDFVDCMIT